MARNQKITPIKNLVDRGVYVTLTIDRRGLSSDSETLQSQKFPVVVLVANNKKKYYYRTGSFVTENEYNKMLKATVKGSFFEFKRQEIEKFDCVVRTIQSLLNGGGFTLDVLKQALTNKNDKTFSQLFEQNIEFIRSEGRVGTANNYLAVYRKFSSYYGEHVGFDKISPQLAVDFKERMIKEGLTDTSINIYLRTLRVHCNIALEEDLIKPIQYPFGKKASNVKIPRASKRKDRFLTIPEILKLMEYDTDKNKETPYGKIVCEALNLWLFSYLGNGLNLADMAELKYNGHYFKTKGKEFEFVRKKTARTTSDEILIHIPIIPQLSNIIERYGATPKKNGWVFPQILCGETEPGIIKKLVTQFNSNIQDRLKVVCKTQEIDANLSMTWARHSFNTNLAHKKVPESYISQAMGHSTESITSGYTGYYSTEDRFRYNFLLLEPDKEA